eukprot:94201-Rhodomonas_salina.5
MVVPTRTVPGSTNWAVLRKRKLLPGKGGAVLYERKTGWVLLRYLPTRVLRGVRHRVIALARRCPVLTEGYGGTREPLLLRRVITGSRPDTLDPRLWTLDPRLQTLDPRS